MTFRVHICNNDIIQCNYCITIYYLPWPCGEALKWRTMKEPVRAWCQSAAAARVSFALGKPGFRFSRSTAQDPVDRPFRQSWSVPETKQTTIRDESCISVNIIHDRGRIISIIMYEFHNRLCPTGRVPKLHILLYI